MIMDLQPMHRSKALESAGYDAKARTLRIHFRNGGLYDYLDVPPEVFEALATSAHPWTDCGARIKSYAYRRLDRPESSRG
jgi:hypothetical protein